MKPSERLEPEDRERGEAKRARELHAKSKREIGCEREGEIITDKEETDAKFLSISVNRHQ